MPTLDAEGISQHYELLGPPGASPILLISGLGGAGASWGTQVERFSSDHRVILPDQRGTGRSSRAIDGYTTQQLAADMTAISSSFARFDAYMHRQFQVRAKMAGVGPAGPVRGLFSLPLRPPVHP